MALGIGAAVGAGVGAFGALLGQGAARSRYRTSRDHLLSGRTSALGALDRAEGQLASTYGDAERETGFAVRGRQDLLGMLREQALGGAYDARGFEFDYRESPGYRSNLRAIQDAVSDRYSRLGLGLSGSRGKALGRATSEFAADDYHRQFGRALSAHQEGRIGRSQSLTDIRGILSSYVPELQARSTARSQYSSGVGQLGQSRATTHGRFATALAQNEQLRPDSDITAFLRGGLQGTLAGAQFGLGIEKLMEK